jgi:Holliday junction resolvase RusA-like endonuclease
METDDRLQKLTIIIPMLPPSANHMHLSNRNGSKRLSDEAVMFRGKVAEQVEETANGTGWRLPDGALEFVVKLTYPSKRRTDIDNRIKAALDAIALALGFDDARIERIVIERAGIDPKRPLCEMILSRA